MPEANTVRLGDHLLPVVPQRQAKLRHQLKQGDIEKMFDIQSFGPESYRILCILIPSLKEVPLWEWEGFSSQEAMEADDYQEEHDKSPTPDEILEAFEMAMKISGGDRLGKLLGLMTAVQGMTEIPTQP